MQGFFPNDRDAYPLYEVIAEAKLPALFHTGQTGIGAGMPGGGGLRIKYANPIYLDDVAADFPDMPIIMAHPSLPWQDEALSVATAQAERLHRPVGLVAEVLRAEAGAVREYAAEGHGAVRQRQSGDPARPLAGGFREAADQARGAAADPEGKRGEAAGPEMKLYTYFRSSAAFRVRIALNLKGLAYEPAFVHLPKGEHRAPAYGAVNPQALLPTLEDGGTLLTQSLAIIEYLEETHPLPPLLPKDPLARARVRSLRHARSPARSIRSTTCACCST